MSSRGIRYKAVIFDFGNTLVQSASLVESLSAVMGVVMGAVMEHPASVAIGQRIEEAIARLYVPDQKDQPDWQLVWSQCFEAEGVAFDLAVGRAHLQEFCRRSETFSGVAKMLEQLQARGLSLGLLSNATGPVDIFEADLVRRGLAQYFDCALWSCAIGYRKPYAQAFQAVLDGLGVAAHEALMVGDSEVADVAGALALGMDVARVVASPSESTQATFRVSVERIGLDILALVDLPL